MRENNISIHGYNSYNISLKIYAPEDRIVTQPLLCIHGFGGSKASGVIRMVAEEMTLHSFSVISFNLPAHGDSMAGPEELTVENCLRDISAVTAWIKTNYPDAPVSAFATSMGGYLCALFLENFFGFRKVILRSPAFAMDEILMKIIMDNDQLDVIRNGGKIDFGFDQPLVLGESFYLDLQAHKVPELCSQPDKVMIIHGTQDHLVPFSHSVRYASTNHIVLNAIEGADHMYENPGEREEIVRLTREYFI